MTVKWEFNGSTAIWHLVCDQTVCEGRVSCIHSYDHMTFPADGQEVIPIGQVRLPLAGEFPIIDRQQALAGSAEALTSEQTGTYTVSVSNAINGYGTRRVGIKVEEAAEPIFLMMLNPEDPIFSIYTATVEFINNQVVYTDGDKFGACKGQFHSGRMQTELEKLRSYVDQYPMLKTWDLLSKLTTKTCIICMWKRSKPVMAGPGASGLGNLDAVTWPVIPLGGADPINIQILASASNFNRAVNDPFSDDQLIVSFFNKHGKQTR